jgi:hypothetical protein
MVIGNIVNQNGCLGFGLAMAQLVYAVNQKGSWEIALDEDIHPPRMGCNSQLGCYEVNNHKIVGCKNDNHLDNFVLVSSIHTQVVMGFQ